MLSDEERLFISAGFLVVCACFIYISHKLTKVSRQLALLEHYTTHLDRRGVYMIKCEPTNASYCGSTRANFMARWGQHIKDLDAGRHVNARLQEDWNRYGRDAFGFFYVAILDDDAAIIARENEILDWRAMNVAPALNYNQSRSKTYPVAAPAEDGEVQHAIVIPRRPKRVKRLSMEIGPPLPPMSEAPFSLVDLGLTPEEIAAIEGTKV